MAKYVDSTETIPEPTEWPREDAAGEPPPPAGTRPSAWMAVLAVLWGERRRLLRWAAAGLAAGVLLAFLLPVRYESTTRLMPPDQSHNSMALLGMAARGDGLGALAGDLLGMKSSGALFVGVLRSRSVQDRLIDRFDLRQIYGERYYETARKELADNTIIAEDRKSGIISIRVSDRSGQRAAALAAAYVEELDRSMAQLAISTARRERAFLEERLKDVKQDLDAAAAELSRFSSQTATLDIATQGKAMLEAAALLEGQIIAAQAELQGLEQIYTPNNVRVRSVRARVAELRRQRERLRGASAPADASAAAAAESAAAASDGSAAAGDYPSIRELPLLGVTYLDLYRRTRIQEAVFEILTKQYELAKVQEAKEIPTVKVLDPAEVPERKSWPPRTLVVGLVTLLLAGTCLSWILLSHGVNELDRDSPVRKVLLPAIRGAELRGRALTNTFRDLRLRQEH